MQRKKYNAEQIIKIVQENILQGISAKQLAARYGINHGSIEEWIIQYKQNGASAFLPEEHNRVYSEETKQRAVEDYLNGNGSQREITAKYKLRSRGQLRQIAKDCIANGGNYGETALKYKVSYQQVYQWTKKFKEMGAAGLEDRRGHRKKDQTPRTELEKAQIEIERLKHELYMTQMERDLLKKLDEIERREAYRK